MKLSQADFNPIQVDRDETGDDTSKLTRWRWCRCVASYNKQKLSRKEQKLYKSITPEY